MKRLSFQIHFASAVPMSSSAIVPGRTAPSGAEDVLPLSLWEFYSVTRSVSQGPRITKVTLLSWLAIVLFHFAGASGLLAGELLKNPGFESGDNGDWDFYPVLEAVASSSGILHNSANARSPSGWYGYLGDFNTTTFHARGILRQVVTLPANVSKVTLKFYLNVTSAQASLQGTFDKMSAELATYPDDVRIGGILGEWSNLNRDSNGVKNNYTFINGLNAVDVSAYAGQKVMLKFYAQTDDSLYTTFRIDDVSLMATTVDPPAAPTDLSPGNPSTAPPPYRLSSLRPTLSWAAVTGASSYIVYLSKAPYGVANIILTNTIASGTSCRLPSGTLTENSKYAWNVSALAGAVEGPVASALFFMSPGKPEKPTSLTAFGYDAWVSLAWNDGSDNEEEFIVERQPVTGGSWVEVGRSGINVLAFLDSSAVPGVAYNYRVRASNNFGASDPSNVVQAARNGSAPASPDNVIAENQNGTVHVSWQNNSNNETGFEIQRRRVSDGVLTTFGVTSPATSYDDSAVSTGVEYCYLVRAVNASGNSPNSLESCVTPHLVPLPSDGFTVTAGNYTPQPGQSVAFMAQITHQAEYDYLWHSSPDGQTAYTRNATFAFSEAGRHTVSLRVSVGSLHKDSNPVRVDVQPNVSGTGTAGSSGNTRPVYGADPVNLASGNYTYEHTDLRFPGVGVPFEFNRFYNSKFNDQSGLPLGYGWSYSPCIRVTEAPPKAVITFGDGHAESFTKSGESYVGDAGVFDILLKDLEGHWLVISKQQTTNHLDANGRLVLIQDRNGNTITLDYESDPAAHGRLKQIVDTANRTTFFRGYSGNPALIGSIEDVLQRTNFFYYDATTNLIAIVDPRGNTNQFYYDTKHQLTGLRDNRGHVIVSNTYDPDLNVVISQEDAYGQRVSFVYDFTNHVTIQTNALNLTSTYQFDERLLLTNRVDEAGFPEAYAYDAARNRILVRDRNGNETHYTYDDRGNVTSKVDALNNITAIEYDARNNPARRLDALTNVTTFGYDGAGNLTSTTNAFLQVISVQYDSHGLPVVLTDPRGFSSTNRFDDAGNLTALIDANGATNRFDYDDAGRKLRQIDALNRTNSFFYDPNDNLIATVNALGQTNSATFDENNNRTSTKDARGAVTTNRFDLKDRLDLVTDALAGTNGIVFDVLDRQIASIDPEGHPTGYELNPIGYLLSVTNALTQVTRFIYDPNGNQTVVQDAAGNTTTNWFDPLNRRYATVNPLNHTNLTSFDALGRITNAINAKGQTNRFLYDALGRLTNVVDAAGGNVFFDYDENGNRIRVTDPNGHSWANRYDKLNRLFEQADPVGNKTLLFYDAVGNLTNRVTPNGASIRYQHDALNRVTNIVYPDATSVTFTFDEVGNRSGMVDSVGSTTWSFDALHRLTSCTDPYGNTVSNRFDAAGNRTVLHYPDGKEVLYGFDELNRLTSFTNWLGGVTRYRFDNRGLVTNTVNSNTTSVNMLYDALGRMTYIDNRSPAAVTLASEGVQLDALGNQTSELGVRPLLPIIHNTNVVYAYDADNRLTAYNGKAVSHDRDGNLTALGTDSYRYDFEDRLLSYAVGGTFGGQHVYDGMGSRLQHTTNGVVRRFVLDRLPSLTQLLAETDANGAIAAYYVYGYGLAERITPDAKTVTYHFDRHGSTVILTSETGERVGAYAYDAFGVLADSEEENPQPFRYLGAHGVCDDGNGLYHVRHRYLNPYLGRFMTKDALNGHDSSSQSFHRYVYGFNNPLTYFDISGDFSTPAFWLGVQQLGGFVEHEALAVFGIAVAIPEAIGAADTAETGVGAVGFGILAASSAVGVVDDFNAGITDYGYGLLNIWHGVTSQDAILDHYYNGPFGDILYTSTGSKQSWVEFTELLGVVNFARHPAQTTEALEQAWKQLRGRTEGVASFIARLRSKPAIALNGAGTVLDVANSFEELYGIPIDIIKKLLDAIYGPASVPHTEGQGGKLGK